jgi:CelD/BcsL family acetyltransferase involved in cellulose biosynthesis
MSQLEQSWVRSFAAKAPLTGGPKVDTIRNVRALQLLGAAWTSLASCGEWVGPMMHHDWAQIYAEVYGVDGELNLLVAGGSPCAAIAPLFRPKTGARRLEFIGQAELYEVMDFIYKDATALGALASELARSSLPLVLKRIRSDSPVLAALRRAYRGRGLVFCRDTKGCPWIDLDESWITPEKHLNAGRRSDLRRARRIAEAQGRVTCEILSPGPAELAQLLAEAYQVEAAGWKGRDGTALLCDTLQGEFYRRYAAAACEEGALRLAFLRINGRAAAMQLAIETTDRFWLHKIGYNAEFARCSPGVLLMVETLTYAARRGLRSYEFLGATEPWIRHWTQREHCCVSFRAYPYSVRGVAALSRDSAAALMRRAEAARRATRG